MDTPTRFILDEARAFAVLDAMAAFANAEIDPTLEWILDPYLDDTGEDPAAWLDPDLVGCWDPINDESLADLGAIVRALQATGIITGPGWAEPRVDNDVDNDDNDAHFRWEVYLGEASSTLVVGEWTSWKYINRDHPDDPAPKTIVKALRLMVSDLNSDLDDHDRYLDSALHDRARSLMVGPGHLGVNVAGRVVATLPIPDAEPESAGDDPLIVTLDDAHGTPIAGWEVRPSWVDAVTWYYGGPIGDAGERLLARRVGYPPRRAREA